MTDQILKNFFEKVFPGKVSELAQVKGLPYTLVYNLVHGRIHSLSAADYRRIFGEDPPHQEPKRVDGTFFRQMVRLWLYLNDRSTESELYREFYEGKDFRRVDYRIFTGEIRTIDPRLERYMLEKFFEHGFERSEVLQGIAQMGGLDEEERMPYEAVRPVLDYLQESLGVNPSRILNQWVVRYATGELKTVPERAYAYAVDLARRTEAVLHSGSRYGLERLREEVYGQRTGLTLFSAVEEELEFLRCHAKKSPKRYLGRSISVYRQSKLKRIASWRARRIKDECRDFIRQSPQLPLLSIPRSFARTFIEPLVSVLRSYLIKRSVGEENIGTEKALLTPSLYSKEEYGSEEHGFTPMARAGRVLGMSKRAFDLLLCEHSEVFRRIAIYDDKWYLPDLYLKEIREKEGFDLLVAKYEFLARNARGPHCPQGA